MNRTLIPFVIGAILIASCAKIEQISSPEDCGAIPADNLIQTIIFEVPGFSPGDEVISTKSAHVPSGDKLEFAWEATDTVGIYPDKGSQVFFSMENGAGTNIATFDGGGWSLKQNSTYSCYYPLVGEFYLDRDKIPVSFTGQTQKSPSDFSDALYILVSEGATASNGNLRFTFDKLNTIIRLDATLPAGRYTRASLTVDEPLFVSKGTFSLNDREIIGQEYSKTLEIGLVDFSLPEESLTHIYLSSAPVDLKGKRVTVRVFSDDGGVYECVKTPSRSYEANKWYYLTCPLERVPDSLSELETPLTFEATTNGNITISNPLGLVIEYLKNGEWISSSDGTISIEIAAGETVSLRGDNEVYATSTNDYYTNISANGCYVYGNIMSLISSTDFSSLTGVNNNAFKQLFSYSGIRNHPTKSLLLPAIKVGKYAYCAMFQGCPITKAPELPATILDNNCYESMFQDCASLTVAPVLPATELAQGCYQSMFSDCSKLTAAPELPAMTLAPDCYNRMFNSCMSLESAPVLPATSLSYRCYYYMFHGCIKLNNSPDLLATTLADYCYSGMFSQCFKLNSAPKLPATNLAKNCYSSMFLDCIGLQSAPNLPAQSLSWGCYGQMFYGCTKLNYVSASFRTDPGTGYTDNWLAGVASTGTFVKSSLAMWELVGDSGIPEGWNIETLPDNYIHLSSSNGDFIKEYWTDGFGATQYNVRVPNVSDTTIEAAVKCRFENDINASFITYPAKNANAGKVHIEGLESANYYFNTQRNEAIATIGDINVQFRVSDDGLSLYASILDDNGNNRVPEEVIATISNGPRINEAGNTIWNTFEFNKEGNVSTELLNTGEMHVFIGCDITMTSGAVCHITFDGEDSFRANILRPISIGSNSLSSFIDAVNFGDTGSYIKIEDILNVYDWRWTKRPFIDYPYYWRYYGPFDITFDVEQAEYDLNGTRSKLPSSVILTQTYPGAQTIKDPITNISYNGTSNVCGCLTYKNNGLTVTSDYNIYIKATVKYGFGEILSDWIRIPVVKTIGQ